MIDIKAVAITEEEYEEYLELKERETPKKPIKRYYTTKYGNNGRRKRVDILCPRCKSYFVNGTRKSIGLFTSRENDFIDSVKNTKYCMFCGTRIDWSEEEMQQMANGIILTCEHLISNSFCGGIDNTIEAISSIFSNTGITKEEFEQCEDDFSKEKIIELFKNEEQFYKELGWIV